MRLKVTSCLVLSFLLATLMMSNASAAILTVNVVGSGTVLSDPVYGPFPGSVTVTDGETINLFSGKSKAGSATAAINGPWIISVGQGVTLDATDSSALGSSLVGWSGDVTSTDSFISLTMTTDIAVTATFEDNFITSYNYDLDDDGLLDDLSTPDPIHNLSWADLVALGIGSIGEHTIRLHVDTAFGGGKSKIAITTLTIVEDPVQAAAVPEPASLAIWGLGALGCAIASYRRRKAA